MNHFLKESKKILQAILMKHLRVKNGLKTDEGITIS
jgi:hypothetical protein